MTAALAVLLAAAAAVCALPTGRSTRALRAMTQTREHQHGPGFRTSSARLPAPSRSAAFSRRPSLPRRLLRWRATGRGAQRERRGRVVEACVALASELRAGAHPDVALQRVDLELPGLLDGAAAAARLGGDVPAELRRASLAPGAGGLASISACWLIAARTGSALAPACDRIAEALRQDEALRNEVTAQLAGARATARLMAGLPIIGILLGTSMGARPLDILFGSPYGICCLLSGVVLAVVGLAWTERLARTVEDTA